MVLPGKRGSAKAVTATKVAVEAAVIARATNRFTADFAQTVAGSTSTTRDMLSAAGPTVIPSEVPAVIAPQASVKIALDKRYLKSIAVVDAVEARDEQTTVKLRSSQVAPAEDNDP